jgi:acetyltransferase-like isoleucine patch superfamily enzyme
MSFARHPLGAARVAAVLGGPGFELPELSRLTRVAVTGDGRERLAAHGIGLDGEAGADTIVLFDPASAKLQLRLRLFGRARTFVALEAGCRLLHNSVISVEGDDHTVIVRQSHGPARLNVTLRGHGGLFYVGRNATANFTDCLVHGPAALAIGEDCMFAVNSAVRTFDSHAILDAATGEQINRAQDVRIGRHVWLGQNATVMPGADVGDGAIVGAGAVVTHPVAARALVVGVPARVLRDNVTWAREAFPTPEQVRHALAASRPEG